MNTPNDPLVEMVPIADLKPDPRNPRKISTHEFESLQRSIDSFGMVQPLVVNKRNMQIVGGHQRWRAALDLKIDKVPVVWVDLDANRQTTLNIGLNKIAGEFDTDQLAELILELDEDLLTLTGFTDEELTGLQADPFDEVEEASNDEKPKTRKYTLDELRTLAKSTYPAQPVILEFLEAVARAS